MQIHQLHQRHVLVPASGRLSVAHGQPPVILTALTNSTQCDTPFGIAVNPVTHVVIASWSLSSDILALAGHAVQRIASGVRVAAASTSTAEQE
jgi:hypothetical protein